MLNYCCGNGKYLDINDDVFKLGCDVCSPLVDTARSRGYEVQVCDGLRLPYRRGCFDAVLSIAGCGNGKYLDINDDVFKLGCDVCSPLVDTARSRGYEVQVCDGLRLPYRRGCFDAVLSIAGGALWRPLLVSTPHRCKVAATPSPGEVVIDVRTTQAPAGGGSPLDLPEAERLTPDQQQRFWDLIRRWAGVFASQ
ncbi:hypothetical protein SKAU_G00085570 [Synaphobranchus kaupii]|uniref:Methyltransferase type 11 domain-containing protein n=1 Tax=Synaphobranchus kaupii TaxID=118154 RepID=A0A9Q1FVD1_SYNKA|nr:hypothetical protein SKAU_G00085570 [Synaphobranchus kaupii]